MAQESNGDKWVYVAIEDPGGAEKFVGLHDKETDISYIPAFNSKEDALACMLNMPRRNDKKYEVQAVLLDSLAKDARANDFLIFMLDSEGAIIEKIKP